MVGTQPRCAQHHTSDAPLDLRLSLLGSFGYLAGGVELPLARGSRRLVALLALLGYRMRRQKIAGTLWPEASEAHANTSLRSALVRLGHSGSCPLQISPTEVSLDQSVRVDLRDAQAEARRLLASDTPLSSADRRGESVDPFRLELLPGWYDDWVLVEAESWRQLRLHALETLSARLTMVGLYAPATLAALAAVSADPLRESARAALIRTYIAEGNRSDALREFVRYRALLQAELALEPTSRLRMLVEAGSQP